MSICRDQHRHNPDFASLPNDQGGRGRHKCSGCAFERGYNDGMELKESLELDLNSLPNSQAGTVRHKSPHSAYALGYQRGVKQYYS